MVSTPKSNNKMPIQIQFQKDKAAEPKAFRIKLDEHPEVSVELAVEAFELASLDAWIRSRFGLQQTAKLKYLNERGKGKCISGLSSKKYLCQLCVVFSNCYRVYSRQALCTQL